MVLREHFFNFAHSLRPILLVNRWQYLVDILNGRIAQILHDQISTL